MVELMASSLFITLFLISLQLVIGFLMGKVSEVFFDNYYKVFRKSNKREHNIITIIGTPIHEVGHFLMCKVFKFNVVEVNLLDLDESSDSYGNVNFEYNNNFISFLGLYFVAVAPLLLSGIVILIITGFFEGGFLMNFLEVTGGIFRPDGFTSIEILKEILKGFYNEFLIKRNLLSMKFWLLIFLSITISINASLSKSDIKALKKGIPYLIPFIIITNLLNSLVFKVEILNTTFININYIILSIMIILLFYSLLGLTVSYVILYLMKLLKVK